MKNTYEIRIQIVIFACFVSLIFSCKTEVKDNIFTIIPSKESGINFSNILKEDSTNIINYLYAYNGGGVAVGDINNDGLQDVYFCANESENQLYLNKGKLKFENITTTALVGGRSTDWSTGVSMVDINRDGWLDIYVCNVGKHNSLNSNNKLYINQKDNTFKEEASKYGLDIVAYSTQAAFFDVDRDGDQDLYLLCHSVHSPNTYRDTSIRRTSSELSGDRLMICDDGKYIDKTTEYGIYNSPVGYGLGINISDFNSDGWMDIYIGNDFQENDYLYLNVGGKKFNEVSKQYFTHFSQFSMGTVAEDIDNDGFVDIMTLDMKPQDPKYLYSTTGVDKLSVFEYKLKYGYQHQYPQNMVQLNKDGKYFIDIANTLNVEASDWSWSPLIYDFDGDGLKDIYIANGILRRPNDGDYLNYISSEEVQKSNSDKDLINQMPCGLVPNTIFRQRAKMTFDDVSHIWSDGENTSSTGSAVADFDNDGDWDIVLNNVNAPASILKNNSIPKNIITIEIDPLSNGIITLTTDQHIYTQVISTIKGFMSQSQSKAIFYPKIGEKLENITYKDEFGNHFSIENPTARNYKLKDFKEVLGDKQTNTISKEFSSISYPINLEDNYYDEFSFIRSAPFAQSKENGAIASKDLDNDGNPEIIIKGPLGTPIQIYKKNDKSLDLWQTIKGSEQIESTCILFDDIDKDGDLDIIANNGASQHDLALKNYGIFIFENNNNKFLLHHTNIDQFASNSSVMTLWDYNQDGKKDIFIGSKQIPGIYGLLPRSFILQNKGNFEYVVDQTAPLIEGYVQDATINHQNQLMYVGHWMPLTLLQYYNGKWTETKISNSTGLWNSLSIQDENSVIVFGLGHNTELRASENRPIKMYISDFDDNRDIDPIISRFIGNTEYPLMSKDLIGEQLNGYKKNNISYKDYAQMNIKPLLTQYINKAKKPIKESIAVKTRHSIIDIKNLKDKGKDLPIEYQYLSIKKVKQYKGINLILSKIGNYQPYIGQGAVEGIFMSRGEKLEIIRRYSEARILDFDVLDDDLLILHTKGIEIVKNWSDK